PLPLPSLHPRPSRRPAMRKPEPPPETDQEKKKRRINRLQNILLAAAMCVTIYGMFFGIPNPLDWFGEKEAPPPVQSAAEKKSRTLKSPASAPDGLERLLSFDKDHAPSYDKRLVAGLKEAFERYPLFLSGGSRVEMHIETFVGRVDAGAFNATFDVTIEGETETYELTLSNASGDIDRNLTAMEKVFREFAENHTGAAAFLENEEGSQTHLSHASGLIADFEFTRMLEALDYIEQRILAGQTGPGLLMGAAEIFSWLAFFKQQSPNRALSDRMGVHAVSCFLMAGVDETPETGLSYYRGLLILALDYPDAAEKILGASRPEEDALVAFIRHDFDGLDELGLEAGANMRLLGWLEARAYETSGRFNAARELHIRITREHPDFLIFKEYAASRELLLMSGVDVRSYLGDLLEMHWGVSSDYTRMDRIKRPRGMGMTIRKKSPTNQWLSRRLSLHGKTVSHTNLMTEDGIILNSEFLNQFLKAEMANALSIFFQLESRRSNRPEDADEIVNMVQNAHSDNDLLHALRLERLYRSGKESAMKNYARGIDIDDAGVQLLGVMLHYFGKRLSGVDDFPMIVKLLNKYRQKQNPDARGLYDLYQWNRTFNHEPCLTGALQAALEANPRDYRLYGPMLGRPGWEASLQRGRDLAGETYGFLITLADWRFRTGDFNAAMVHYQAAAEMDPGEAAAYYGLGRVHRFEGRGEEAIAAWREYPAFGEMTPETIAIKNAVGWTWLELGEYALARDIFQENKNDGRCEALLGYAEASEELGKSIAAEKKFTMAAERCPLSDAPAALGMYYLRRKNSVDAGEVFHEYKRYHNETYYYDAVIDHYVQIGAPETAVELVVELEEENPDIRFLYDLARQFEKKEQHEIALSIHESYMKDMEAPEETMPWLFGAGYIRVASVTGAKARAWILPDLLSIYKPEPLLLERFGARLIFEERYDAAFKVFDYKYKEVAHRRDVGLRMMAEAWRLGSRDEDALDQITERLKAFPQEWWL
ncbi:MAG: hypothetical protein GY859_18100, partial [Desulfobacterales bacterium]|nr:hypothetical protein [Desulfobacterales bacterium]